MAGFVVGARLVAFVIPRMRPASLPVGMELLDFGHLVGVDADAPASPIQVPAFKQQVTNPNQAPAPAHTIPFQVKIKDTPLYSAA